MKTLDTLQKVQSFGITESKSISISANAKAFKALISGIYSDKHLAICRELFANAHDSHVEAGKQDVPFKVVAPSMFNPVFTIRDYGVSMDHDMVMGLYSQLFDSTKDDPNSDTSNNYVGKFGLGSKTPFAYTDAYQVITYLDGTMRSYDVFLDGGVPTISLFSSVPTKEPDGVEVTFPVEPRDCAYFTAAINKVLLGYDTKPEVKGITPEPEPEVFLEGSSWKVYKDGYSYNSSGRSAFVRQGTIIYPISFEALGLHNFQHEESEFLLYSKYRLDVPIGELDISASREGLSYDKRTTENLVKRLKEFYSEFQDELRKKLGHASSYADFCLKAKQASNTMPYRLRRVFIDGLSYRGRPFKENLFVNLPTEWNNKARLCYFSNYDTGRLKKYSFDFERRGVKSEYGARRRRLSASSGAPITFILEDENEKLYGPCLRFGMAINKALDNSQVHWVRYTEDPTPLIKRIIAGLGRPEYKVLNLADFEPPKKASQTKVKKDGINLPVARSFDTISLYSVEEKVDSSTEGYYVEVNRVFVELPKLKGHFTSREVYSIFRKLVDDKVIPDLKVYAVNKTNQKYLKHLPKLQKLEDLLVKHLSHFLNEELATKVLIGGLRRQLSRCSDVHRILYNIKGQSHPYTVKGYSPSFWGRAEAKEAFKRGGIWNSYSIVRKVSCHPKFHSKDFSNLDDSIMQYFGEEKIEQQFPKLYQEYQKEKEELTKAIETIENRVPLLEYIRVNSESIKPTLEYIINQAKA